MSLFGVNIIPVPVAKGNVRIYTEQPLICVKGVGNSSPKFIDLEPGIYTEDITKFPVGAIDLGKIKVGNTYLKGNIKGIKTGPNTKIELYKTTDMSGPSHVTNSDSIDDACLTGDWKDTVSSFKITVVEEKFEGFGEIAGFNLREIGLIVLLLAVIYLIYSKA